MLELSRAVIDAAGAERIGHLVAHPIDWRGLVEASIRHGIAPLVGHALDTLGDRASGVPDDVRELLASLRVSSERRNRRLFEALGEIVRTLRSGGVDPVGLKDAYLAVQVYPQIGLRPMGDLDLLIRRDDWDAAASALHALGFVPRPSADVPYTRKYAPAQHFRRADDEIWIDLQWNVMEREWDIYGEGRFTYDGLGMWQRAKPIVIGDYELRVPTLEEMLFHLCLHLEGHRYSELVLFCDIAELLRVRGHEMRWDELVAMSNKYRSRSSVYYVLLLASGLLDATVPEEILGELEPPYFAGELLTAAYGNLTQLHLSLDDIRLTVAPPPRVMDELERVVRRQAVRARMVHDAVDELAVAVSSRGGTIAMIDGAPPARRFPDPSLPAFEPIRLFVPERDADLVDDLIVSPRALSYVTRDPVLSGEQPRLTVAARVERQAGSARGDLGSRTNARSALRSLWARLLGSRPDDAVAVLPIEIHAMSVEELIVTIAARLGSAQEDRLFAVCPVVDALRRLDARPDPSTIGTLAAERGVQDEVAVGLAIAAGMSDRDWPTGTWREAATEMRVLEWARYGPSSQRRYPWLRAAYYLAFSALVTHGARARLRFLRRSFTRPTAGGSPVLPALMRDVMRVLSRRHVAAPPSLADQVHWLEPDASERAERWLQNSANERPHLVHNSGGEA